MIVRRLPGRDSKAITKVILDLNERENREIQLLASSPAQAVKNTDNRLVRQYRIGFLERTRHYYGEEELSLKRGKVSGTGYALLA